MLKKDKPGILVENSLPLSESDSEPDSEAMMRRRRREGYPFPEAVALLEKFLKEAEEKIEETHQLYSLPGKVLTMEEISTLDRKLLGIAAIRRRVGEKMKKLEEDCWKEIEEVLERGGTENDRNEERSSYILAILPPSRDPFSLIDFLEIDAPEVKKEMKQEMQFQEVDSDGGMKYHPKPKRRRLDILEDTGSNDVDIQNEADLDSHNDYGEMNHGFDEMSPSLPGDSEPNDQYTCNLLRHVVDDHQMKLLPAKITYMCDVCSFTSNSYNQLESHRSSVHPRSREKRKTDLNFHNAHDGMNDELDEMRPPSGDSEKGLMKKEDLDDTRDGMAGGKLVEAGSKNECQNEKKREKHVKKRSREIVTISRKQTDNKVEESEGEGKEKEEIEKPVKKRSCRLNKPATYTMEEDCDDESSGEEESSSSDMEEDQRLDHFRRKEAGNDEEDQEDENMDQVMDRDDSVNGGNDEKKCPVYRCSEMILSKELVDHMMKHSEPFKCGICKRIWPNRRLLRRHYMIHTGEKPFKCRICKKSFTQSVHLRNHLRTHTGEKPHSCTICNKRFSALGNLVEHMWIHTGERPFECDKCDFKTAHSSNLRKHKRRHTGEPCTSQQRTDTGEGPYECTTCQKRFSRPGLLKSHLLMHSHDRHYECHICGHKTLRLANLKIHQRSHT